MIIHDLIGVGISSWVELHPSSFQQFSQWITPVDGYGYITWKNATAPENPETNTKGYSDI
jgi:hypothetical protein